MSTKRRRLGDSSFRSIGKKAGFKSPNFVKLVMDGKRNLTASSGEKLVQALGLDQKQSEFFLDLVRFNQATSGAEKQHAFRQLTRYSHFKKAHPLKKDQFFYLSQWYYVAIRELIASPNFNSNPEWVAKALYNKISPAEAKKAIEALLALGLIELDEEGRYQVTQSTLNTDDELMSIAALEFHKAMTAKAAESLETIPAEEREFSSVTLSLGEEKFHKIKRLTQQFREEVLSIAEEELEPNRVFQMNLQIFPLSTESKKS